MRERSLPETRDRIGLCSGDTAKEVLQRLTWIGIDAKIINRAFDDVEENRSGAEFSL
ncbi:MAG TPA: hypothetical protein VGI71_23975 [Scandinavium sp.]|jgi:hypothetical protein